MEKEPSPVSYIKVLEVSTVYVHILYLVDISEAFENGKKRGENRTKQSKIKTGWVAKLWKTVDALSGNW